MLLWADSLPASRACLHDDTCLLLHPLMRSSQVVGTFLESGSADENAAMRKVALERPDAPAAEALAKQGAAFALDPKL